MNRREFVGALGVGLIGLGTPWRRPARGRVLDDVAVERWSWAMGQRVRLELFAESEAHGYEAAAAALAELRRVERHLSLFDDASDLVALNRGAGRGVMRVDRDLATVVAAALEIGRRTDGAFNVAVEPLMRAWGFHAPRSSPPSAAEIAEARAAVLAARVRLDRDRVALPAAHTQLDLGGIGVGYGLDRAVAVLRRAGIKRAFLDVSGDCYALGAPPGREGWLVEVADPHRPGRTIAATRIRDAALATSANTVSVVRYGRAVRGHVMDPETGWPADARVQVSVVARTGIEADALSTAMLVSGRPAPGVRWFHAV